MAEEVRDAAFWKRFSDEMNAFHAVQKAKFAEAVRRERALAAARDDDERERATHAIPVRWSAIRLGAPTATSGNESQVLTVAREPAEARKRKWWRWF